MFVSGNNHVLEVLASLVHLCNSLQALHIPPVHTSLWLSLQCHYCCNLLGKADSPVVLCLSFNAMLLKQARNHWNRDDKESEGHPQAWESKVKAHAWFKIPWRRVQLEGTQHKRTKLAERQTGSKTVWEMLPYLQTLPLGDEILMSKQRKTAIFTIKLNDWAVFSLFFFNFSYIIEASDKDKKG